MNKKDLLYKLIEETTTITSKQATEAGFARIYLSMLEEEGKIFKISRGVYSIKNDTSINPLYEFQKNNKKVIYSGFTALDLLNYYHNKPAKMQISVPQGYNASRYKNNDIFYNNTSNYGIGTTKVDLGNSKVVVYDIERTICDIIKEQNRYDNREYNKLINYYFSRDDINYQKLLEYSKLLKVSKKVQNYLSLFKA